MRQNVTEDDYSKGDKITVAFTDSEGNRVREEKTVRMILEEKNAVVTHFDRGLIKLPSVEGDSGAVENKFGDFRGYNPVIA